MGWSAGMPQCGTNLDGCSDWGEPVTRVVVNRRNQCTLVLGFMLGWDWAEREHWGDQLSNQAQHYAQQAQQVRYRCKSSGIPLLATSTTRLNRMIA